MTDQSLSFLRTEVAPAQPAPHRSGGVFGWARRSLLATPGDTLLTVLGVALIFWIVPPLFNFLIGNAVGIRR